MEKKEILKQILIKLEPYRTLAKEFLILIEEADEGDNEFIENLFQDILREIRSINNEETRTNIKSKLKELKEKAQQIEENERQQAEDTIDDLLNNI